VPTLRVGRRRAVLVATGGLHVGRGVIARRVSGEARDEVDGGEVDPGGEIRRGVQPPAADAAADRQRPRRRGDVRGRVERVRGVGAQGVVGLYKLSAVYPYLERRLVSTVEPIKSSDILVSKRAFTFNLYRLQGGARATPSS
jgi:hypothetical protein